MKVLLLGFLVTWSLAMFVLFEKKTYLCCCGLLCFLIKMSLDVFKNIFGKV